MLLALEPGNTYDFEVIRSNPRYSILERDEMEFPYPRELVLGEKVRLKIKSLTDGKVIFDVYDFSDMEDGAIFPAKYISIEKVKDSVSNLKLSYRGHIISIWIHDWLSELGFSSDDPIYVHLRKFKGKPDLRLSREHIKNHYKYVEENVYEFILLEEKNNDLLSVQDPQDSYSYLIRKHYASFNFKKGQKLKLRYLHLDKYLKPILVFDNASSFVEPRRILNQDDYAHLLENRKASYDILEEVKNKIASKDNFWIITSCRYLGIIARYYLTQGEYAECLRVCSIYNKLAGFIRAKNFFNHIPLSLKVTIEPLHESTSSSVSDYILVSQFLQANDKPIEEINTLSNQDQLVILENLFSLKLISEHEWLGIVEKHVNSLVSHEDDNVYITVRLKDLFYYRLYKPLLEELNSNFFHNREDKLNWFEEKNLNNILKLSKLFVDKIGQLLKPNEIVHFVYLECVMTIVDSRSTISENIEKCTKVFEENRLTELLNYDFEIVKEPEADKTFLRLSSPILLYDFTFGLIIGKTKWVYVSGNSLHLLQERLLSGASVEVEIIEHAENVYKAYVDESIFKDFNFLRAGKKEIEVIYKAQHQNHLHFCTYALSEGKTEDLLLVNNNTKYFPNRGKFLPGQKISGYLFDNQEDPDKLFGELMDDKYEIDSGSLGKNYTGIVTWLNSPDHNSKCERCNVVYKHSKSFVSCDECGDVGIKYVELEIPEIQKSIRFCPQSISGHDYNRLLSKIQIGVSLSFFLSNETFDLLFHDKERNEHEVSFHRIYFEKNLNTDKVVSLPPSYFIRYITKTVYNSINEISLFTSSDSYSVERLNKINLGLTKYFKGPRSYLIRAVNRYRNFVSGLGDSLQLSEDFSEFKNSMKEEFERTLDYYPSLGKILDTLDILELLITDNHKKLLDYSASTNELNRKLSKLVLIRSLIKSEDSQLDNTIDSINRQIILLLNESSVSLDFAGSNNTKNDLVQDPYQELIVDIMERRALEGQNLEFKESFIQPVLSNSEIKILENLKLKLTKSEGNRKKIEEQIASIESKYNKPPSKEIQDELAYSTIKNLAAFLNTNPGKVVIGISDRSELKGLDADYKVLQDFDGFQLKFEEYWKKLIIDSQNFRPFLSLNHVIYNGKEFCVIDAELPMNLPDLCFIRKKKNGESIELCLTKNSSSTHVLSPRELYKYKRKTPNLNEQPTYVYLMRDKIGMIKIGIAKDPTQRYGTLKSENEDLKLINCFIFPNRKIAKNIEDSLHSRFKEKRAANGSEYFSLSNLEEESIISELENFEINISGNLVNQKVDRKNLFN